MFTGEQASPPNRNSFHVSSLPTCPNANVYRGRLNHLLMSFPQHSLTITLRKNMVLHSTVYSTVFKMSNLQASNGDSATKTELINILKTHVWTYHCGDIWKHTKLLACSACQVQNSHTAVTFGAIGFSVIDISLTACSHSVWVQTARQGTKRISVINNRQN